VVSVWRMLLLTVLIGLMPLLQACGKDEQEARSEKRAEGPAAASAGAEHQGREGSVLRIPADRMKALGIRVEAVRRGAVPETITATAFIEPNANRIVHVTPRIPGKIIQVLADWGDTVKQGQRLALLDSVELREVKAQYVKARVSMEAARVEYARQLSLYEKGIAAAHCTGHGEEKGSLTPCHRDQSCCVGQRSCHFPVREVQPRRAWGVRCTRRMSAVLVASTRDLQGRCFARLCLNQQSQCWRGPGHFSYLSCLRALRLGVADDIYSL
jgi:biotin carboxyl carrier protein